VSLLTQFGATSVALSKLLVYTKDLGPTRIDFNLGTPRSEISSHSLQTITAPVILSLQTQSKMKLPSKQPTYNCASQLWCSAQAT